MNSNAKLNRLLRRESLTGFPGNPALHSRQESRNSFNLLIEYRPVRVLQVKPRIAVAEVCFRKGIAECLCTLNKIRFSCDKLIKELLQMVRLFQIPAEPNQLRLHRLFEHFGQLATTCGKAHLLSGCKPHYIEVG